MDEQTLQGGKHTSIPSLVTEIIPEYEDVTGQDTEKIEACARILKSKFKIFKMKINQISALADATCSASD